MIFFTSDTHFGSERTLKLSRRPFNSIYEMDEFIIVNWNNIISPNDVVYHLGDFGNIKILKYLNGIIKLIPGNYDLDNIDEIKKYENNKFKVIEKTKFLITIDNLIKVNEDDTNSICLVHKPSEMISNIFNLFGHVHQLSMVKKFTKLSKTFYGLNVGVDCHRFYPIDVSVVNFYKNAIFNYYDKEVFL